MVRCAAEKNGRRTITIEIIGAAKKNTAYKLKEANTCMLQIHVANDDDDEQSLVHTTFTYECERNKPNYENPSLPQWCVRVCARVYLCTWPFILAATAVCVAAAAVAATSLITFEAWLHWKANHVPSNCLCATRLNFIWLVTSRPFTTLTESVLFDAWFFRSFHSISFGCEATHPASHSVSQPANALNCWYSVLLLPLIHTHGAKERERIFSHSVWYADEGT